MVDKKQIWYEAQTAIDLANPDFEDDGSLGRVMSSMQKKLSDGHLAGRLDNLKEQAISLRSFCCLVWPELPAREIEAALSWSRLFRAQEVLNDLLQRKQGSMKNGSYEKNTAVQLDVDQEDVDALFTAIDIDGDGVLSLGELVHEAGMSESEARKLMALWDRDRDGTLNEQDIKGIVYGMDAMVRRSLKGLLAASMQED